MVKPKKALIVKKEYLDLIFNNGKIWEMRSTKTKIRGRIGLIESGSGLIMGETILMNCLDISYEIIKANKVFHQVKNENLLKKWKYPWVISGGEKYNKPIPYKHPRGAVIWVKLSEDKK